MKCLLCASPPSSDPVSYTHLDVYKRQVKDSSFKVFVSVLAGGGQVKGICAPGCLKYSRREIDALTEYAAIYGARGLAWIQVTEEGPKSSITKFFTEEQLQALIQRMGAKPGDLLLFVADNPAVVADS